MCVCERERGEGERERNMFVKTFRYLLPHGFRS